MKNNQSQGLNINNEKNIIDVKSKNKFKKEYESKSKDVDFKINKNKDKSIKEQYIHNYQDDSNLGNQIKYASLSKYGEIQKDKQQLSSKVLRTEFDKIQSLLKNRDLSSQQLNGIVSQKLLDQLVHAFYEFISLEQQIARIIIQIYSHYPVKHLLYNKSNSNFGEYKYKKISYIVVPLMFNVYKSMNQLAALQCVQGVIGEGNVNILEVLKLPAMGGRREKDQNLIIEGHIDKNIQFIVKEWAKSCKSIFVCGVLQIIYDNLKINFQTIADNKKMNMSGNSKNSKTGTYKSGLEIDNEKILLSLVTQLTNCILTVEYCSHALKIENKSIQNLFKLYVDYGCHSLSLPAIKQTKFIQKNKFSQLHQNIQTQQKECELLFKWALYSICESIHYTNIAGRKKKIKNSSKQIFTEIMSYIQLLINKTKIDKKKPIKNENSQKSKRSKSQNHFDILMNEKNNENQNNEQTINNTKIHHIINFIFSLFYPYSNNKRSNEFKLIVLMKYSQLFLHLINNINIEDNVQEQYIQTIILCIFHVAIFCDQFKKKHKLEALLQEIQQMGILSNQMSVFFSFDDCESVLYRLLISIEKCLPRYSLKYYDFLYIERPGIFHLYFMSQILNQRNPTEVTQFLVYLVQRWIRVQMRDFNVLGYICKFITHFLSEKTQRTTEQNLKTLLIFFRSLSEQALVYLNVVFYQSSFSEMPSALYTYNQLNRKSILPSSSKFNENSNNVSVTTNIQQKESILLPTFTFTLPPLTLCSFQQQSQLKSCGYSYTDKSLFIDKNFCIGQQMLRWSVLLYQINDDQFYYNCKYFYFLLTASYNKKQNAQKKGRNSKIFEEQNLSFRELSKNLSKKIDKILQIWEESILKNKTTLVHSIFQIIMCWSTYTLSNSNEYQNQIMSRDQLKKVLHLLLDHSEKLIRLPAAFAKNWREALKQMQINNQLLENYKKQESKIKNKQLYFMRSIAFFFQNIATRICSFAPKSKSFQQILQIIQSYSPYTGGFTCWRSYRLLSEKMSRNFFIEQSMKILNQSQENGEYKMGQCIFTRKKLQVYRQIIFAFIEQDTLKINNETQNTNALSQSRNKHSQPSQHSKISQSSQKSHTKNIEQMSEFELKTKISDIVKFCIEVFSYPIVNELITNENTNLMKTDTNIMKNDKQQLYNKFLALEIIQQFFNNCITNKSCLNLLMKLEQKSSREKRKITQNNQNVFEPLRNSIIKVLFRDRALITKYQRRLIMYFRSACLNWVAGSKSMLLHLYLKEDKQNKRYNLIENGKNRKINCFLNIHEISLIMWHLVLDEQVQLRIQAISILTNNFKYENFSFLQSQILYVGAILTLVICLEPKMKVKLFADKIANIIWSKFIESKNQGCDFLLKLIFTIGSLIYNSKTSIPSLEIFDTFCNLWMRNNKENYYILMCALEQLDNQNYKFKKIQILPQEVNLGSDLKNYYINVKAKRGWINGRDQSVVEQKTQTIFKHIKMIIADKNKHAKFLKSKKQIIFELSQFVKHPDMMPLIERMSEIQIKDRQKKQISSQHINFTLREPSDQSTSSQNNDCEEKML